VIQAAVSLAAAGLAVAGAASAATIGASAGGFRRDREGQSDDRQSCEEKFFHILIFSVEVPLKTFRGNAEADAE
jgi:hypothetical protein